MNDPDVLPDLKQLVGALFMAASKPLDAAEIRNILKQVAEEEGGALGDFAQFTSQDIQDAVHALRNELTRLKLGFHLNEVALGFRLESDPSCGPWLRRMLDKAKPARLSRPALETLAIIAYRQPCTRGEIESVRGVAVDQIIRNLLELQLIRVAGRSDLPGRPWLFGTTQRFLEQFGLKGLDDLPNSEELRKLSQQRMDRNAERPDLDAAEVDADKPDDQSNAE
jgi:segregation and condensation protein B